MLLSDDVPVAFRSDSVEQIEKGVDTVLRLRPARAGSAITPDAATITIEDDQGNVIIDAADAVLGDGGADYVVLGSVTTDLDLAEGWLVTWTVTLPGETVARVVPLEAALILHRLSPPASDQDLFRRVSSLDPSGPKPLSASIKDFSPYLDEAWSEIQERLIRKGDRPWLTMNPSAFRQVHVLKTLQLVFEDLRTRLNPGYAESAAGYEKQFLDAWNSLRWSYDDKNTGKPSQSKKKSPGGSTWLGGRMP